MKLKMSDLILDFDFYPRNEISSQAVSRLVDAIEAGIEIPPIIVDRKSKRITDGFHRYEAHKRLKRETIIGELRDYTSEAAMFEDSVALNSSHGRPFDSYDIRRSVARLQDFGISKERICQIIHVPPIRLEEITRGFAHTGKSNEPVALKGGLMHFSGNRITRSQARVVESASGMEGTYHARQLLALLDQDMWKPTEGFIEAMDRLVVAWPEAKKRSKSVVSA